MRNLTNVGHYVDMEANTALLVGTGLVGAKLAFGVLDWRSVRQSITRTAERTELRLRLASDRYSTYCAGGLPNASDRLKASQTAL
jgi:hypothetical protein